MSEKTMKVAVYGSLRKGMGNHGLLKDSELLSTEVIKAKFEMVDLGSFPGLIESEEPNDILIEVWGVTPETYRRVEMLEGYPSFYDRKDVTTSLGEVGIYYLPSGETWGHRRYVEKTEGVYDWVKHHTGKRRY